MGLIRAFVDANVYISYLLNRERATPPVELIAAAFRKSFVLLHTEHLLAEVIENSLSKPYLSSRISQSDVTELVDALRIVAESVPPLDPPYPEICADRKDDYLFAHAIVGRAKYLVSGDSGVRAVERIGDVRVVTPAEFLAILKRQDDG